MTNLEVFNNLNKQLFIIFQKVAHIILIDIKNISYQKTNPEMKKLLNMYTQFTQYRDPLLETLDT